MIGEKRTTNLRWLCQNLDYLRVPLNATERSTRSGPFPYWGANGIVDHLNEYLVDEPVVLIGEDGAPFFEPHKPVAFYVDDKIWPNNHIHILRPGSKIEGRFLTYYLNTVDYSKYINGSTRDKLTQTQLGNIKITYPELPVQKSIVRWLDVETARIEGLIAKKTKLIDLLNEKLLAVVTHTVTSGLTPSVPMQPTGLSWLSQAPAHWNVYRLATLLRQVNEAGDATLPVLSVSIHTGISDRQLDDEERDRKVVQIEDKTSYKRVRPNDLAYNMMRAWQGAFGIATVDGLVSPAYVVSRPSKMVYPPYLEYLLRTPLCVEEMRRASKGIASFRLRMYWEAFRQIRIALPPFEEQQEIARYLADISSKISRGQSTIAESIERLREYRSSLVAAVVNGQIEFDAKLNVTTGERLLRAVVSAEIIDRHRSTKKFGRVKLQKILYLAEVHANIAELGGVYLREAAGPLDRDLMADVEKRIADANYYRAELSTNGGGNGNGTGIVYIPLAKAGKHRTELSRSLGARANELARIVDLLRDFDTRVVEAITTLYAVWNDALIEGRSVHDDDVIDGFLNNWHPEKSEKFRDTDLQYWLDWMRRNDLVPQGKGPKTVTGRLFP